MKNKPHPALLWPSNLSNEIKKGTKISWDYPFNELAYKTYFIKTVHYYQNPERYQFQQISNLPFKIIYDLENL
jgi:hypothetical protein